MNESIYKHIKALPPLDDTVVKIQAICRNENSSMNDLSQVVEKDPMLTANVLRSANSPLYGFSREITTVSRAVALFGMATVRGFALSSAVKKSFKINLDPYGITNQDFLNISMIQNALMYNWYSKINASDLAILSPASFMLEVGKIVISNELNETGKAAEFKANLKNISNPFDLSELENKIVEISNETVTAKIFEQWNLESELVDAIFYSNNPDDAPEHIKSYSKALKVVKSAVNIFNQLNDDNLQNTLMCLDEYGFAQDKFLEAVAKVKANL
ncbi:HDOD domain-containing protein [Campylobacter showae]|uniref:Thiamine-phosphate kinase n=1 Tax=Campylobacter showae CC57C TaxID=1073353 RepID=M3GZD8_9BACT|nr:HDOD domain-containing protein [Campylobacter showae]EMG30815.1 thiamine-phosphate kinase [Campylobacter showae CC57C]